MVKSILALLALGALALAGCASDSDDNETLAQLRSVYVDTPLKGGQETPMHTWLQTSPNSLLFLHWNKEDPADATGLWFVGDGIRAKGCIGAGGISQAQIDAGYVHFHKENAADWDQGHHTSTPSTMGYWLRHVAADDGVDPMGIGASPRGEVYALMPSGGNAPAC